MWPVLLFIFYNVFTVMKLASFRAPKSDTTEAPSSWWRISWEWRAGVSSFCCPMCIINSCSTGRESSGSIGKVRRRFIGLACSAGSHCCDLSLYLKNGCSYKRPALLKKTDFSLFFSSSTGRYNLHIASSKPRFHHCVECQVHFHHACITWTKQHST